MKRGMEKFIKKVVNKVHLLFGENSGKMLLLTGIIGMALSSLAQTLTIVNNKHYTLSQKMFMVPQELIDGAVSIFSLVLITTPLQNLAKKYVKNGKLLTKDLRNYLNKTGIMEKRNENWAAQIKTFLEEGGNTFIFVGAAHLIGENSVFEYLKKYGVL